MSAVLEYPQRHAVSADEYLRMGEAGVFAPEARLELIEGEIVEMAPIGSRHAGAVNALNALLVRVVGERAVVAVQNPLIISGQSVPQPDLALLAPRADSYSTAHPTAADVLLVIEVADTTLAFDLERKIPLYARHGVAEAWVVDLQDQSVRAFRDPSASGYRSSSTGARGQSIEVAALPGVSLDVAAIFPR